MSNDVTRRPTPNQEAADAWAPLRRLTAARIGLPRAGASLATSALLDFRLAHARARDAVHTALDEAALRAQLEALGLPVLTVASAAADRSQYLLRPDLGRSLASSAISTLDLHAGRYDVALVVTEGLSAGAVQTHACPVLTTLVPTLAREGWCIAPIMLVRLGRVAIGDRVARALGADSVVILIGERPGLTAPDSMGAYLTWNPGPQTTDAERNCISNIRPDGTGYADAASRIAHLLREMRARRLSGVALEDSSDTTQSITSDLSRPSS
ncbi:MAG: ethanolamine ammonia-lyase subunit EutC [Xanthobacteraceae bacterium]|nr:ethanolamine ammonia-lyase subunit EutC [Xanthobacteraceae bacterium]